MLLAFRSQVRRSTCIANNVERVTTALTYVLPTLLVVASMSIASNVKQAAREARATDGICESDTMYVSNVDKEHGQSTF